MGEFSIFHWLVVLLILVNLIPIGKILSRTGHNPGWCVFFFFPAVNLIMLWVFAFKSWPIENKQTQLVQQPK